MLRNELVPLIDFTLVALAVGTVGSRRRPPRFSEVSFPFSKLSHILSGTSKWLKFGGRKEGGNNEGGEEEERMGLREGEEGGCAPLPFCKRAACACMPKEEGKRSERKGVQNSEWEPKE